MIRRLIAFLAIFAVLNAVIPQPAKANVTAIYQPVQYAGNGTTTAFSFPYQFFAATDLMVTLTVTATGAADSPAPVLNGGGAYGYTVTGTLNQSLGEYPSATITFNTAPPSTDTVTIAREAPATQPSQFGATGPLFGPTIESTEDRQALAIQQLAQQLARRTIQVPTTDPTSLDLTLPPAASRANMFFAFDNEGQPILGSPALETAETIAAALGYAPVNPGAAAITAGTINGVAIAGATTFAHTDGGVTTSAAVPLNITTSVSGTPSGNYQPVSVAFNDSVAEPSGYYAYPAVFTDALLSTSVTGARPGLTGQIVISSPTSATNPSRFYSALSGAAFANVSDNGTSGSPQGYLYGASAAATLLSGANYWGGEIVVNASAFINSGASAIRRIGFQAEADGAVRGSAVDAAYDIWAGTSTWGIGVLFDDSNGNSGTTGGTYPIMGGGVAIQAATGPTTANGGINAFIDISEITSAFTGGGNAIVMPIGTGAGISWAFGGAGGYIISTATTNGAQITLGSGALFMGFGGSANATLTASSLTVSGILASTLGVVQLTAQNSPADSTTCTKGQIEADSNYIYYAPCAGSTGNWKRVALSSY